MVRDFILQRKKPVEFDAADAHGNLRSHGLDILLNGFSFLSWVAGEAETREAV